MAVKTQFVKPGSLAAPAPSQGREAAFGKSPRKPPSPPAPFRWMNNGRVARRVPIEAPLPLGWMEGGLVVKPTRMRRRRLHS